jgi:hypothetical protein
VQHGQLHHLSHLLYLLLAATDVTAQHTQQQGGPSSSCEHKV